jgi:hypothetical protein
MLVNPLLTKLLTTIKTKEVRDLAWVIGSEPLISKAVETNQFEVIDGARCRQQLELHSDWLLSLAAAPEPLLAYLPSQSYFKLGHYFEALVGFWLTNSPSFESVERNIQINTTKRTLGEADVVLLPTNSDTFQHWELAVKYYLGTNNSTEWAAWIGPNPSDSLAIKMSTMTNRQLRLFDTVEGKAHLKANGIQSVSPHLFLKGYFFNALKSGKISAPKHGSKPNAAWWCAHGDAADYLKSEDKWVVLPKVWWLAPALFQADQLPLLNASEMLERLNQVGFSGKIESVMIAAVEREGEWYKETYRVMVVADRWPQ